MTLIVTPIAASICGLLLVWMTLRVIAQRLATKAVYGDMDDKSLMKRIRGHGNATEQMPIFLIMLGLLEYADAYPRWLIAVIAAGFVLARMAHAGYFMEVIRNWRFRRQGMLVTLSCQGIVAVLLLVSVFL